MDQKEIIKPKKNLFLVKRTSNSGGSPLKGCFKANYYECDTITVDPKKIKSSASKEWYSEGENHRVENGYIKRDILEKGYFLEINNIMKFVEEVGENCIVSIANGYNVIEIYDSYRE